MVCRTDAQQYIKAQSSRFSLLFSGVYLTNKPVKNNTVFLNIVPAEVAVNVLGPVVQKTISLNLD